MKDEVFERFQTRLEDLGLTIDRVDDGGQIHIEHGDNTLKISLDNVRKSHEQDGTFDHLDNLIDSIHSYLMEIPIPAWDECKEQIYFSLFPSSYDFSDFINDPVTDDFNKYYIFHVGQQYTWINRPQLEEWGIDEKTFKAQVNKNMDLLLDNSNVETMQLKKTVRHSHILKQT